MAKKPRITLPKQGNLYYNKKHTATYTKGLDGYNPCILGNYPYNSKKENRTGYPGLTVLPDCTGFVVGAFNECGEYGYCKWLGDAYAYYMMTLAKHQGLKTGTEPKIGAVICWSGGNDGSGHVEIVTDVTSAKEIKVASSGWNTTKLMWTKTRRRGDGNWGQASNYPFQGFIYHPDIVFEICPYTKPSRALKKGNKGEGVKWVQWHLNWYGYNLDIDGSFGPLTDKAVRDFQTKHGLKDDGSVGPLTKAALVNNLPWNTMERCGE